MATIQAFTPTAEKQSRVPAVNSDGLRPLMPDEYPNWDRLVESSPQGSVFCYSWWLRAVSTDIYVLGYFDHGALVAGIPLHFERRHGLKVCCMPQRTVTWGVIIEPLLGKRVEVACREMEILTIFADYLAKQRVFVQFFHPSLQNCIPFLWNGFKQTTRFTYVLDDLTDTDRVWEGLRSTTRRNIRKATRNNITVSNCSVDAILDLKEQTLKRNCLKQPRKTRAYLRRLYDAAKAHDAAECFAAKDCRGRIHAASLLVWDCKAAYYLIGGRDEELLNSDAQSLLMWHLIQVSAQRTKTFDFEGSQVPGIERYFRTFGPKLVGCNWIMKFPIWLKIYLAFAGKI